MMRSIKKEIRVVGFDDAPFVPRSKAKVPVIGVVFRGGSFLDGVLKTEITVDGIDATPMLTKMINKSKHKGQLRVIMLNGVTIGGFNIVNIVELSKKTGLPVIVVNRKLPNMKNIEKALKNFGDFKTRWKYIKEAGKVYKMKIKKDKNIYFQFIGLEKYEAERIIELSCTRSLIPEPLRAAHLIASALIKGESGGRA